MQSDRSAVMGNVPTELDYTFGCAHFHNGHRTPGGTHCFVDLEGAPLKVKVPLHSIVPRLAEKNRTSPART